MKDVHAFAKHDTAFSNRNDAFSILEAIGAIAAVSAGLWLGAAYLGVDLRDAWNMAANKTGLEQFAVTEDGEGGAANSGDESDAEANDPGDEFVDVTTQFTTDEDEFDEVGELTDSEGPINAEIEELRAALQRLENAKNGANTPPNGGAGNTAESAGQENAAGSKRQAAAATLKYWNTLNKIMLKEEQLREAPSSGLTPANAGSFLEGRGKASRFASETISKLKTAHVDPAVVQQAQAIAAWYEQGAKLNDKATFLFTKADPATRRGPLGQEWSTAEKQHQNELQIINRRSETVRQNMTEKYGVAFPKLR